MQFRTLNFLIYIFGLESYFASQGLSLSLSLFFFCLCEQDFESADHILIHCKWAVKLWSLMFLLSVRDALLSWQGALLDAKCKVV